MTSRRFLGLDGLRGVCALTVLFYHSADLFHQGPVFLHGFFAVDVFFIMSGFVIALTYEERLKSGDRVGGFLFSRAKRLFPTYWLGAVFNIAIFIAITTTGYLATLDTWWMIWIFVPLTTLLVIPDYITPDGMLYPAMDSVAWSLFAEWVAYIVYGFRWFRWKTSRLALFAATGWAVMVIFGFWSGGGWHGGADRVTFLTLGLLRCLPSFAAGVVIYRIHRHSLFQRLPVIATEILLLTWFCLVALPRSGAVPVWDTVIWLLCPVLVCLLIRSEHRAPAFCGKLGELSYPLYVMHPGIIVLATYTPLFGLSHGPRPLNAFFVLGLCLALAWVAKEIMASLRGGQFPLLAWLHASTGAARSRGEPHPTIAAPADISRVLDNA